MFDGLEGMKQFYVASGSVKGFKFERGRWRLIEDVEARNKEYKKVKEREFKSNVFCPKR
jgi:hypothetical protein